MAFDGGNLRVVVLNHDTELNVWKGELNLPVSLHGVDTMRVAAVSCALAHHYSSYTSSFILKLLEPEPINPYEDMMVLHHTVRSSAWKKQLRFEQPRLHWLTLKRRYKDITSVTVSITTYGDKRIRPIRFQTTLLTLLFDTDDQS